MRYSWEDLEYIGAPGGEGSKDKVDLSNYYANNKNNLVGLSNVSINKGQGNMFSYTNNNPAAKPWEERVKNQQDKSLRKNIQGSKPSDDFKAFEKLTNK
ncbi:MAG: hypothetical protein WAZ19_01000, partial [Anaerolineae bacterium]